MPEPKNDTSTRETSTGLGCLIRLLWMLIGHAVMALSALTIAQGVGFHVGVPDVVFAVATVACIAVRYWDITRFAGLTAGGEPATVTDWRRYTLILLLVALVLWGVAHGIAFRR
jgi:hypothetical protein